MGLLFILTEIDFVCLLAVLNNMRGPCGVFTEGDSIYHSQE